MQQKLITFAVPCYNSAAYMRHCIETLLTAGEQAETTGDRQLALHTGDVLR